MLYIYLVNCKYNMYFNKILKNSVGQAMSEYIIIVTLVALVCIPVYKTLPDAVRGYMRAIFYTVSRPLP